MALPMQKFLVKGSSMLYIYFFKKSQCDIPIVESRGHLRSGRGTVYWNIFCI